MPLRPLKVLVVVDSDDDCRQVLEHLGRADYEVTWRQVATAEAMREALVAEPWDVIIADYALPRFSAPNALATLQESGLDVPFIVLSGTIGEETVLSLKAGARDVLLKTRLARLAPAIEQEREEARQRHQQREAAEALRRQEAQYRALAENSADVTLVLDAEGRVRYQSPSAGRLLGHPPSRIVGQPLLDFVHPEDLAAARAFLAGVASDPATRPTLQLRVVRADQAWCWLEATASNQLDNAAIRGVIVNSHDVTALVQAVAEGRRAAEELRHQEARFRKMIEHASDVVTVLGPDGAIRYVSQSFSAALGYPPGKLIGTSAFALVHPDDVAAAGEVFAAILADPSQPQRLESRLRRHDGSWLEMETTASNLLADPDVSGVVLNSRDVSARKAAERALRAQEAHFRALIENGGDVITILDGGGAVRYLSPSFTRILGHPPEGRIGSSALELIHPDDQGKARAAIEQALATPGASPRVEYRYRHRSGAFRHLESTITNLLADPDVAGLVVNSRDVTDRVELQEQYLQAQKMELVGRLAGGVAHDFNNLLTVIRGNAEFLLEGMGAEDPRREDAEQIRTAAERAVTLTRQLLTFSRRNVLDRRILDLNAVVTDLEKLLHRLLGEDVELVVRVGTCDRAGPAEPGVRGPADLERCPPTVLADRGQLEQVITNLCVNARDAMPAGGTLTLTTRCVELDAAYAAGHAGARAGPHAELTVSDTGAGMTRAVMDRVFEPFFTTKEHGTGLGLATVSGIVEQGHGHVTVESALEKGTTFRVYLPRAQALAGTPAPEPRAAEPGRGSETVLLVEDEPAVGQVGKRALEQHGYLVLLAADAEEALRLEQRHQAALELLVTDVVLPGISGWELAERLRKRRPRMRVLYISGYTADRLASQGVIDPGARFLEKPFLPDALARRVREVLDAPAPAGPGEVARG